MNRFFLLLILIVISSLLRFYNLGNRGLFTDEKFTMLNANGIWVGAANQPELRTQKYFFASDFWKPKVLNDYFESIAHSDFGTHIIYNGFVHFWMKVFGNSDFTVRLLSAIFNLITVVLVFLLTLKVFKSQIAAFFAGLFLAVDPLNVAMSHIARSYTLSFLLMIISTIYFLKIIDSKKGNKRVLLFVLYAFFVGLGMLNHYLNFLVPLSHALVFLIIRNKKSLWFGFISAGVFNILLMVYWFNWGGGYTAFGFLKDKNEKHLKMAQTINGPLSGVIQLSTPEIVSKKAIGLFFDSNLLTQSLYNELKGVKNVGVSVLVFLILVLAYFNREKIKLLAFFLIVCLLIVLLFYQVSFGILISNFFYFSIFFGIKYGFSQYNNKIERNKFALVFTGFLMLVVPILFIVYDAFKNGHTTSLTHRYIGIASPFVAIFIAIGLTKFIEFSKYVWVWFGFVFFIQFGAVKKQINDYFDDKSEMNAYFEPARIPNPYISIANNVAKTAIIGDTLIHPGRHFDVYEETFESEKQVSYQDAQYLNLYLPIDSKLPQRIDLNEKDKVFLKRKTSEKILLFDFEGTKYRY